MTLFRANWNRARALDLEIQEACARIYEAKGDPCATADDIKDMKAELYDLEREFFLTGATSEFEQ